MIGEKIILKFVNDKIYYNPSNSLSFKYTNIGSTVDFPLRIKNNLLFWETEICNEDMRTKSVLLNIIDYNSDKIELFDNQKEYNIVQIVFKSIDNEFIENNFVATSLDFLNSKFNFASQNEDINLPHSEISSHINSNSNSENLFGYNAAKFNSSGLTLLRHCKTKSKLSGSSRFDFVDNEIVEKEKKVITCNLEQSKLLNGSQTAKSEPIKTFESSNWLPLSTNWNEAKQEYEVIDLDKFEVERILLLNLNKIEKVKKSFKLNKKKIRQKIEAFANLEQSKKTLYFWTITFPALTSDDECFKYLNNWLTKLRKANILHSYIWVSERQEIGTLHFHILINERIPVVQANEYMKETLLNVFKKDPNHWQGYTPEKYNGIDIAKNRVTRKITNFADKKSKKSLKKYLTKYITKNETAFNRLVWHCSRDISALFTHVVVEPSEEKIIDLLTSMAYNFSVIETYFAYFGFSSDLNEELLKPLYSVNQIIADSI